VFDYENIRRNLDLTLGLCLTERVMLELVKKGVGRQEAHELMRRLAMKCWNERRSLREVMMEDGQASGLVTEEELDNWLKPENYLGTAVSQVDNVVRTLKTRFP
jgi:adenylosuccinate lyase